FDLSRHFFRHLRQIVFDVSNSVGTDLNMWDVGLGIHPSGPRPRSHVVGRPISVCGASLLGYSDCSFSGSFQHGLQTVHNVLPRIRDENKGIVRTTAQLSRNGIYLELSYSIVRYPIRVERPAN